MSTFPRLESKIKRLIRRVRDVPELAVVMSEESRENLTLELEGTLVTQPTWQFGSTDAVDTVVSSVPTALNAVVAGNAIEIITDGGGGSVMPGTVTLVIERT